MAGGNATTALPYDAVLNRVYARSSSVPADGGAAADLYELMLPALPRASVRIVVEACAGYADVFACSPLGPAYCNNAFLPAPGPGGSTASKSTSDPDAGGRVTLEVDVAALPAPSALYFDVRQVRCPCQPAGGTLRPS